MWLNVVPKYFCFILTVLNSMLPLTYIVFTIGMSEENQPIITAFDCHGTLFMLKQIVFVGTLIRLHQVRHMNS